MLGRQNRFHGHGSLRYVYQKGKTVRTSLISVKYSYNSKRKNYRLAVVVSKKVNSSAVKRNRIRRRIYSIVSDQPIKLPYDIVITVFHDSVREMDYLILEDAINQLLRKAGVIS